MNKELLEYFKGDDIDSWDILFTSKLKVDGNNRAFVEISCKKCNLKRNVYISTLKKKKGIYHGSACTYGIKNKDFYYTKLNKIYYSLLQRTSNEKHASYKYYGEKGIKSEFIDFIDFYKKMYNSYKENYITNNGDIELDRIDNNGNYSIENCRWVTHKINSNNRGPNSKQKIFIAISPKNEISKNINQHEFAKENNLDYKKINLCLNNKATHHKQWKFQYE